MPKNTPVPEQIQQHAIEEYPTEANLARKEGRDYEPASELLKRIQAEREKETQSLKPRKAKRRKGK